MGIPIDPTAQKGALGQSLISLKTSLMRNPQRSLPPTLMGHGIIDPEIPEECGETLHL